jgi:2-oxoglutarate ferredoxin oxidoreductase subunit alpha
VVSGNIAAGRKGYEVGGRLAEQGAIKTELAPDSSVASEVLLNGGEAVTFGAIAGGCNFVSSYPMSPSTPVLTGMAQATHEFDIVVEQAEDEIAAINMALGASFAGGRTMVTTSGGGFALMCEGVSLAGMIETPVVIHLAQRPGPATGLPTRTEQGDLDLALYAGHGEFPRAIFAPGTLEQAFSLTARAFDQADKHQSPAFVLTDQYLIDSFYNTPVMAMPPAPVQRIVASSADYVRHAAAKNGVSPRAIPGNGEGVVRVDSDEHTEEGLITEDASVRTAMQRKRMAKLRGLTADALPPQLIGPATYRNLVVCWGSNYHIVKEALSLVGRKDLAALHFSQVYPLAATTGRYLRKARGMFVLENNACGQFANLLQREFGRKADGLILKYDGLPFSVEDVARELGKI